MRGRPASAARQAGWLLAIGCLRTLLAVPFGADPHGLDVVWLATFELVAAATILLLPWARWPSWSILGIVAVGLGALAWSELLGLIPERASGVPFVIVAAWVAAHQPRSVTWALLPAVAAAFAAPALARDGGADLRALLLTLGACLVVSEVVGRTMRAEARAAARAQRAVTSFRVVAQASADLHDLEPDAVLATIASAVIDLGYDGAALAVVDDRASAFRVTQALGSAAEHRGCAFGLDGGLAGHVRRTGKPARADDLPPGARARASDRDVVAAPVTTGGAVVAVLFGTYDRQRAHYDDDVEAMRMLAAIAATALENAHRYTAQRESARHHAVAALTDQLTGVGNRRRAEEVLVGLTQRDTLVMIDLDHFKNVNDNVGHTAGDEVLRALARHLQAGVREIDHVLRYGGEEFLLVLHDLDASKAERLVQRLLVSWRETEPATTFSAGVAQHLFGASTATVEHADRAMYAAKAAGRDTYRTASAPPIIVPAQGRAARAEVDTFG